MPRLKRPASLKDRAMEELVTFFANYCDKHSKDDSWIGICTGVTAMKNMSIDMTKEFDTEFCHRFMDKFLGPRREPISRPRNHVIAISELVMDREVVGLTCPYRLINSLHPDDLNRIIGLKELDLGEIRTHRLKHFHLENLTHLRYEKDCTDSDVRHVAQNCKKLSRLFVWGSKLVTDVGLHALIHCSHLRYVDVTDCSVTPNGISKFLSVNKSVREICSTYSFYGARVEWFSLSQSAFPFIESLRVDNGDDENLRLVERKFPNLTSLEIRYNSGRSPLPGLKSLSKLTNIRINASPGPYWKYLEDLVGTIGDNLKRLALLDTESGTRQRDLDLIFKHCPNLEYFECDCFAEHVQERLVIPPFPRLICFRCSNEFEYHALIEYGEMPELEKLALYGFGTTFEEIKSMMFDHARLPKLKMLRVTEFRDTGDDRRLEEIARVNNLDIVIRDEY